MPHFRGRSESDNIITISMHNMIDTYMHLNLSSRPWQYAYAHHNNIIYNIHQIPSSRFISSSIVVVSFFVSWARNVCANITCLTTYRNASIPVNECNSLCALLKELAWFCFDIMINILAATTSKPGLWLQCSYYGTWCTNN